MAEPEKKKIVSKKTSQKTTRDDNMQKSAVRNDSTDKNNRKTGSATAGSYRTAEYPKRLYRSKNNAMIAGVAAGLAEYFMLDVSVIRLIFVLAAIFGGFGIPLYIILWVILPSDEIGVIGSHDTIRENTSEIKSKAEDLTKGIRINSTDTKSRNVLGYILVIAGGLFILQNLGIFRSDLFWPLVLVVAGLLMLR